MDRRYDPDTTTPDIDAERARVPRGEWLVGAGEMAESIRSLDWSSTPLGPREHWPESLRTVVNLLVASRFPMALLWGRELLLIYNDAYRVVAGGKHPAALGRSTREIWPEVWHVNEPILAAVVDRGETVYLEDACFPINRHGYPEDAYFTLCYAPYGSRVAQSVGPSLRSRRRRPGSPSGSTPGRRSGRARRSSRRSATPPRT